MTSGNHKDRAHALLSASSAHRWLECPASAMAAAGYPSETSEFAAEGTLAHEVAEAVARGFATGYSYRVQENATTEMIDCAIEYRNYISEQLTTDAPLILLERRVDFSPWVPDGFGTADCIIIQGNTMDVIDYKYGKGVDVSAEHNPQEMLYGLGALNDYGFAYDIEQVRLHIFQPRIHNVSVYELTAEELLAWGDSTVRPIAQKAAKGKGGYKAGSHCKFCPHAGRCRALTKTCTDYVETHSLRVAVPVLADHEVAEVLEMEPLISLWLKRVKAQAMTSMMNGRDIPGYKLVEGKQGNRKWADQARVMEIMKDNGYTLEDITETKLLSPAGMDAAIGKKLAAELLGSVIVREPGSPIIVRETDKRPVFNRLAQAQEDFKE